MRCKALIPVLKSEAEWLKSQAGCHPNQDDRNRVENLSTSCLAVLASSPGGPDRYRRWFDRVGFDSAFRRRAVFTKSGARLFEKLVILVITDIESFDRPAPVVALDLPGHNRRSAAQLAALSKARAARWTRNGPGQDGLADDPQTAPKERSAERRVSEHRFSVARDLEAKKPGEYGMPILTSRNFPASDRSVEVGNYTTLGGGANNG